MTLNLSRSWFGPRSPGQGWGIRHQEGQRWGSWPGQTENPDFQTPEPGSLEPCPKEERTCQWCSWDPRPGTAPERLTVRRQPSSTACSANHRRNSAHSAGARTLFIICRWPWPLLQPSHSVAPPQYPCPRHPQDQFPRNANKSLPRLRCSQSMSL